MVDNEYDFKELISADAFVFFLYYRFEYPTTKLRCDWRFCIFGNRVQWNKMQCTQRRSYCEQRTYKEKKHRRRKYCREKCSKTQILMRPWPRKLCVCARDSMCLDIQFGNVNYSLRFILSIIELNVWKIYIFRCLFGLWAFCACTQAQVLQTTCFVLYKNKK